MLHIPLGQQILEQLQRCHVEPLQIIEKERERMLRARKHGDESAENQLKAGSRLLRRKIRDGWLHSDDELQFGD